MNPPSEDIKDFLLDDSSLALTFGTDLFVGYTPDSPDAVVGVYDSGGDGIEMDYTYERPSVQVRIRGDKGAYRAAQMRGQAIRDYLKGIVNQTKNSARYLAIWPKGDVLFIGRDEKNRPMFSVNFTAHRTNG